MTGGAALNRSSLFYLSVHTIGLISLLVYQNKQPFGRTDYNVYSTFQSHEPEFDYLKSVEIEEKINDIAWLKRRSPAHFILSTNGNG
jgi:hypothetical protein